MSSHRRVDPEQNPAGPNKHRSQSRRKRRKRKAVLLILLAMILAFVLGLGSFRFYAGAEGEDTESFRDQDNHLNMDWLKQREAGEAQPQQLDGLIDVGKKREPTIVETFD
jgi:flagellar basal body-associated protein FliL